MSIGSLLYSGAKLRFLVYLEGKGKPWMFLTKRGGYLGLFSRIVTVGDKDRTVVEEEEVGEAGSRKLYEEVAA